LPDVDVIPRGFTLTDKLYQFIMREARKPDVTTIVFSSYWELYFIGSFPNRETLDICRSDDKHKTPLRANSPETGKIFEEFGADLATLKKMGKEVIIILPSPEDVAFAPRSTPRLFYSEALTNQVSVSRSQFEAFIHPVKQLLIDTVTSNGGKTIDPLDYFAEGALLNGKTLDGRFRYIDNNHMRPSYVIEKATFFDDIIRHN
jgi:hypothetical protein